MEAILQFTMVVFTVRTKAMVTIKICPEQRKRRLYHQPEEVGLIGLRMFIKFKMERHSVEHKPRHVFS